MPAVLKWIFGVILVAQTVLFTYMAATTGDWWELGIVSVIAVIVLGGLIVWMHMRLDVDERGICMKIRPLIRLQRSFLWEDVMSISQMKRGMNFGGWGIRYAGDGWGYIFDGKDVLKLELRNGKTRYITTNNSEQILQIFHQKKRMPDT